jgi:hypothetical protein
MNENVFNMKIRKFLKQLSIGALREIERATQAAVAAGTIPKDARLKARAKGAIEALGLHHTVKGDIALE